MTLAAFLRRGFISVPVHRKMKSETAETADIIMALLKPLVHPYLREFIALLISPWEKGQSDKF